MAFVVSVDQLIRFILIGAIIFVIIVEVLNTGVEAACNALSRQFHADIKIVKDCGSFAFLLATGLASAVWAMAVWSWLFG